jgi:DNA-binding NarL/FixJ family response regulator
MKDILVTILEDDIFSRNWMSLLLVRDWRTRLVGEFSNQTDLCVFLDQGHQFFDILILDVDFLGDEVTIDSLCEKMVQSKPKAKILLIGVHPNQHILNAVSCDLVCGYVLKEEVGYSLSWVISLIIDGQFIVSPGVFSMANRLNIQLPKNRTIIKGRLSIPGFTDHEAEVARMAIIFSLGRKDLADELKISEQWSYGLVSEIYTKMGLKEILSGEEDLFSYIGENKIIRHHFEEIMAQLNTSTKARDLETLAYHLITMPEILN